MKTKLIIIFMVVGSKLLFSTLNAQNYYNIDIKKLDKALQEVNLGEDFIYEPVIYSFGYVATYKNNNIEIVVTINSFEEIKILRDDTKLETFKWKDKKYHYYETKYVSALYYDMNDYNISFAITTYHNTKEYLIGLMEKIQPDNIIRQSYVQ